MGQAAAIELRADARSLAPPRALGAAPRVLVAHEWLVARAGSERVVEALLEAFPGATLATTLLDPDAVPPALRTARTSLLQHLPGATRRHEWLVPLMPLAWRLAPPARHVDVVVSSSHACAKAVRVPRGVAHVCYCHTPMRYAWDFEREAGRFPAALRPAARALMTGFRAWDRRSAVSVTRFVANSRAVRDRIRRAYGRDATVVHPPVDTGYFTPGGARGDFFLYAGRLVPYKRPDLAVAAFAGLPFRLVVAGTGPLEAELRRRATPNVELAGRVDDAELRDLYRSARALVFPGEEDFGIVMAEALACGTPVVALSRGGALDIVDPGETGWLVEREDPGLLRAAVRRAAAEALDPAAIRARAERFAPERFQDAMRAVVEEAIACGDGGRRR